MLFIGLQILMASCANIPDTRYCVEVSPVEAKCIKMVSGIKEDWNDTNLLYEKNYWDAKSILIRIHPEEVAKLKAYFLKTCKKMGNCKEVESKIKNVEENLILK